MNLRIKTSMSYIVDVPRPSSAESHAAQIFRPWITAWHSQTTSSLGAYTRQSDWQDATPLQQPPARNVWMQGTAIQPPLPVMSVEDAFTDISFVREGVGSKETPFAAEICPFPNCEAKHSRSQELERHIRERHLPHYIYCEQLGCNWTGNRRYALRSHLVAKHSGVQMPEVEAFTIYDAKGLVKQLLNRDISVEQAVCEAQSLFQKKVCAVG